ncbi:hypothetical protein [Ornithinimicrobium cryptoxanthini]|uniref:Uncharacterized protein n=2 Tax=Ornithinimicrobium cryptoxanthini TaxID=2934161 RepID=A0ABY4YND9_9MICO|nr:hypothetical protein [Ornithinimicrobium cryptoxanthini]USQ78066.1 hypothetical protein NF557_11900 [Ornithinimicrobium cryptoxanthini]
MQHLMRSRTRLTAALTGYSERLDAWARQPERGDVPGWVLITIMTAGLVAALWLVAEPLLSDLFVSAVSGVSGP